MVLGLEAGCSVMRWRRGRSSAEQQLHPFAERMRRMALTMVVFQRQAASHDHHLGQQCEPDRSDLAFSEA